MRQQKRLICGRYHLRMWKTAALKLPVNLQFPTEVLYFRKLFFNKNSSIHFDQLRTIPLAPVLV